MQADPERVAGGNGDRSGAAAVANELARRIGGKNVTRRGADEKLVLGELRPGQLCIAPVDSWQVMAAADPPEGAALMMVLQPPALVPHDERSYA